MIAKVLSWVGEHATIVRIIGATSIMAVAVGSGLLLAGYSQSFANAGPAEVESVIVASVRVASASPTGGQERLTIDALRATSNASGLDIAEDGPFELDLTVQASGEKLVADRLTTAFVIGGTVASHIEHCGGLSVVAVDFDALEVEQQEAVLVSIEDQLVKLETLRGSRRDDQTSDAIRARAHQMRYVVLSGTAHTATWQQQIADRLRTVPLDSNTSPGAATQDYAGVQWDASCRIGTGLLTSPVWGRRFELPGIGLAAPIEWGTAAARQTDTVEGAAGIALETESSLAWRSSSADFDRGYSVEGKVESSFSDETVQSLSVQAIGALTADSVALLSDGGTADRASQVTSHVTHLAPVRYSLRFTSGPFRETRELALFLSGAVFGLAATLLIALIKTFVRIRVLRAPKE